MIIRSFITTIFAVILFSGLGTAAFGQAGANATWRVQKYDIVATMPQDAKMRTVGIKAVLSLKNVSSAPASSLTLRISTLAEVTAVRINDSVADFGKERRKDKFRDKFAADHCTFRIDSTEFAIDRDSRIQTQSKRKYGFERSHAKCGTISAAVFLVPDAK